MKPSRARRAAFVAQANDNEALLTITIGIPACQGYIRAQIARDLAETPWLCEPEQGLTKPLRRIAWHDAATAIVTSGWWVRYSASTEVDQALARRADPNATMPIRVER